MRDYSRFITRLLMVVACFIPALLIAQDRGAVAGLFAAACVYIGMIYGRMTGYELGVYDGKKGVARYAR